ncbi:hypothetical protein ACFL0G_01690, partial [Candidatus Zixiibacteriota bacterium]
MIERFLLKSGGAVSLRALRFSLCGLLWGWSLIFVSGPGAEELTGGEFYSLFQRVVILEGDSSISTYQLPDGFLLPGREQVWVDGEPLARLTDFQLDYDSGALTLSSPPPSAATIRVKYERLPFQLKTRYLHREQQFQQAPGEPLVTP